MITSVEGSATRYNKVFLFCFVFYLCILNIIIQMYFLHQEKSQQNEQSSKQKAKLNSLVLVSLEAIDFFFFFF